ncbi:MAG: hypothetical protein ACKV2Q_10020 [Planctomycetaceae bacterium]
MARDITDEELRQLNPTDVRWYAVGARWKQVPTKDATIILLQHPVRELRQLLIPTNAIKDDNLSLLYEVVRTLADDEQRPPREVLKDLLLPPADVMQLRVQSEAADSGTMPLDEGLKLLQSGSDLLLAAACSAHQPQASYARQSFAPAQEFLKSCRRGQTENGRSFMETILAPVPAKGPPSLFAAEEVDTLATAPFQRRVTLLLMQGIGNIRSALDQASPERVVENVAEGVSANLCEALVGIKLFDSRSSLEVRMRWSRTRPPVPTTVPNRVSFAQSEFPYIETAGRALRERFEPRRERVTGHVINLHAEPADLVEKPRGQVIVRALIADRAARVRFQLEGADYLRACDAHRTRQQIEATGMLHRDRQAKLYELQQMHGFHVLPMISGERDVTGVPIETEALDAHGA